MEPERRYADLRQADTGRLDGVVMSYNSVGEGPAGMPETFRPGAFGPNVTGQDLILNGLHNPGPYEQPPSPDGRGRP